MTNKFGEFAGKAKDAVNRVANDEKTRSAAKWTKETAITTATEATRVGKKAVMTEMGKSMAIPAVLGALIAIPLPLMGPPLGALLGAAFGYYLYSKRQVAAPVGNAGGDASAGGAAKEDVYAELAKLDVLKRSGTLSEEEFSQAKSELLKRK